MSGYIGTQPVPQATQTRDSFTATSGQTSFATGGYTPTFLDVYLNGVKLAAADYTASNGSDVVLATGATTGDILEVVAYTSFEVVSDTVTNAGTALNLDRTGSNGTILDLKKDGSTVGSIGATSGDLMIGTTDTGFRFLDGAEQIIPWNVTGNTNKDGVLDLGNSTNRFDNLYLSGGVYLGGTGAANQLDDYETGTFTPTFFYGTVGTNNSTGDYTKIGNTVYVNIYLSATNTSSLSATNIGTLPFTPNQYTTMAVFPIKGFEQLGAMLCAQVATTGLIQLYYVNNSSGENYNVVTASHLNEGANVTIRVAGSYTTNS